MTSFEYWGNLVRAGGGFLCSICYESFPPDQAWVDAEGQKWDVCLACAAIPGNVAP